MPTSFTQRRFGLLCLLFLAGWALRLRTLHPAFHADDSPETATAAAVLGIQHPPGYPLPTLLGRLAVLTLPGAPAFASNLLAALASIVALFLIWGWTWALLADTQHADQVPWLVALLCLGMPQLWFLGLSAKGAIYTLNLCLSLAVLWAGWQATRADINPWTLALGALCLGLGLAGHAMSMLALAPALFLWSRDWRLSDKKRAWFFIFLGLSLYLYLPLRARLGPALNWGDPQTLDRFWQTLTRAQYAGAGATKGVENTLRLSAHFLKMLPAQLTWPGLLLGVWGLRVAWRTPILNVRPLVGGLAIHLGLVLIYNNPPAHAPWVIDAFFLPDFVLLSIFAGLGFVDLYGRLVPARQLKLFVATAFALAILAMTRIVPLDYSQDYLLYDYSHDLILSLPKKSVLLTAGGNDTFGVWYLQKVLQRRQDVVLIDVPLLGSWYTRELKTQAPDLPWNDRSTKQAMIETWLHSDLKRPLYHSSHNPGDRGIPLALVTLVPNPRQKLSLTAEKIALPWLAVRQRFLNRPAPIDGNRAELWQYYPDSALALRNFAQRAGQAPLAQWAEATARRYQNLKP